MFGSCWHHLNLNPFCQCCGMTGHIQIYLFIQQATQEKVCSDIPCETIYLVTYAEWRDIWNHLHTFFSGINITFLPTKLLTWIHVGRHDDVEKHQVQSKSDIKTMKMFRLFRVACRFVLLRCTKTTYFYIFNSFIWYLYYITCVPSGKGNNPKKTIILGKSAYESLKAF